MASERTQLCLDVIDQSSDGCNVRPTPDSTRREAPDGPELCLLLALGLSCLQFASILAKMQGAFSSFCDCAECRVQIRSNSLAFFRSRANYATDTRLNPFQQRGTFTGIGLIAQRSNCRSSLDVTCDSKYVNNQYFVSPPGENSHRHWTFSFSPYHTDVCPHLKCL